jgi:dipeptidyl aminopeptidase/acylaminoacyl peptidase
MPRSKPTTIARCVLAVAVLVALRMPGALGQGSFTLEQVLGVPFNSNLVAAENGNRVAWTSNQQGRRNIWVAEGPNFVGRQLTSYSSDDGGELSALQFSPDGGTLVYSRGEGKDSAGEYANPTHNPAGAEQEIWAISWTGGAPVKIDEGNSPTISKEARIAYARSGEMWVASLKAADKPSRIVAHGKNEPVKWSPDGTKLLFASDRGDHSFVGVYDASAQTVKFLAPTVDSDSDATWSLDGKQVAFVRQPAVPRDTPDGYFIEPDRPHPWSIWVADADTGSARKIWQSGSALQDSFPYMARDTGGGVLNWAGDGRLVFASEADGWQHLYSISVDRGTAKLLTPGECEAEQWSLVPDKKTVLFNSNCGDIDRRHLWSVDANGGLPAQLTSGESIEWGAVTLSDARYMAYFSSDATHPGRPFVHPMMNDTKAAQIAPSLLPTDFPADQLAKPEQVVLTSSDGLQFHGQLFLPKDLKPREKRAALVYIHGGPMRQMLLGWHYMYYYANGYAMNQFLASRGYVVLAINYRSGIGYGRAFREAPNRAARGASEYQDVLAAGKYLQSRADVDAKRIGLWGGSYGGYLTALGLGRNSDIFATGVDFHGVHDWPADNWEGKHIPPDLVKLAHDSSPVAAVNTWRSPVLFIHGDDDRNVMFSQTVDLVARLRAQGVEIEQLIFPDEVHDFLLYRSWLKALQTSSEYLGRKLGAPQK